MQWKNKQERKRFLTALYVLAEVYDKAISEDKARAYFMALSDLPIEQVERAIHRETREAEAGKWLPRPGDLRKTITGSIETRAELEADKVLRALEQYGRNSDVAFDDPVTSAVVHRGFGGWELIGRTTTDHGQKWFRRDFVRLYLDFTESGVRHEGVHKGALGNSGSLALVGDRQKALALSGKDRRAIEG